MGRKLRVTDRSAVQRHYHVCLPVCSLFHRSRLPSFWVLLGIEVAAYVVGWAVMVPLGRRKRRRELESETVMMDKAYRA